MYNIDIDIREILPMKKFLVCALPLFALTLLLTACTSGAPAPESEMKHSETILGIVSGESVHGIDGKAFTGHEGAAKDETILGIVPSENVHGIASESQYKDLRQFIPDDADEQVEEMMASSDGPISLLGDSGRISVDTIRATDWSGNYSKTLAELLLLPRDPYIAIEFRCYRGCGAAACTDPDHYHWCTFNCDEPDHYHNFIPSKACEDGWCTDPNHYHWCPYGCREAEHGHLPYQWKYF